MKAGETALYLVKDKRKKHDYSIWQELKPVYLFLIVLLLIYNYTVYFIFA